MTMTQKANVKSTVKHVLRQIARISNPQVGYQSTEEVDAELNSLMMQGYRIVNTHYIGKQTDVEYNVEYFGIMYILQLEQAEVDRLRKSAQEKLDTILEGNKES